MVGSILNCILNMKFVKIVFQEVQSRKTEELYLSIQRAQEEAFKDKHIQRIRDLAKQGHDVSKLLHSLEGDSVSHGMGQNKLFLVLKNNCIHYYKIVF